MKSPKPNRLEAARLEKLQKVKDLGMDPWGQRFDDHIPISEARERCPEEPGTDGDTVRVAGRIMLRNNRGKLKFYHVQDWT
ncbi:MAG TPA: lysine--tRNA ligase, partial [Planctomycetaceae bacterium]|nr:lysine--tRNA ligase [Planctomycetaceae bacterium]